MICTSKAALLSSAALLLFAVGDAALAQTDSAGTGNAGNNSQTLPSIEVTAPKQASSAPKKPKTHTAARRQVSPTTAQSTSTSSATEPASQADFLPSKKHVFDQ